MTQLKLVAVRAGLSSQLAEIQKITDLVYLIIATSSKNLARLVDQTAHATFGNGVHLQPW